MAAEGDAAMSDPWIQRYEDAIREDEEYAADVARDRLERAREKGSVDSPPLALRLDALEPPSGPMPDLSYQGEPRVHEKLGMFDSWGEAVGFAFGIVFSLIVGLTLALAIFFAVAWAMSGP